MSKNPAEWTFREEEISRWREKWAGGTFRGTVLVSGSHQPLTE
jgi:hypothetical protein